MRTSLLLTAPLALLSAVAPAATQTLARATHEVERIGDLTLICDVNTWGAGDLSGTAVLVDASGRLVHFWPTRSHDTHSAEPTTRWDLLISATADNRVFEVTPNGFVLWNTDWVSPLSDGTTLDGPNDAKPLPNDNVLICERFADRVIEIDRQGQVIWKYPSTPNPALLDNPHNPERLPNGNTLIADTDNHRILEVDAQGQVVWGYGPAFGPQRLNGPRDCDELPNGLILIADTFNNRLVLVDRVDGQVGTVPIGRRMYEADALANGNYLVSGGGVREFTPTGQVVWEFPPNVAVNTTTLSRLNPTTGVNLSYTVHRPADAGPTSRRPAVVFVPDGVDDGSGFVEHCDYLAGMGYVAVRFDPDGRGQSTNGGTFTAEGHGGIPQQDGLQQILLAVAARPDVDPGQLVVASYGYGLTMAAGCLSRHAGNPNVAILRDWEGPASRTQTAAANGGLIPESPSNSTYWAPREAITSLPGVAAVYLRHQSAVDHDPAAPALLQHALDLHAAAVQPLLTGSGSALAAQMNLGYMNLIDVAWSAGLPPKWIPEGVDDDTYEPLYLHLALERTLRAPVVRVIGPLQLASTVDVQLDAEANRQGEPFAIFLSAGDTPAPPSPSLLIAGGALGANGDGSTTLAIPADPILIGVPLVVWGAVIHAAEPIQYTLTRYTPFVIAP